MLFKLRANFHASKIYDVEAESEDEARRIAIQKAESDFDYSSKDIEDGRFGYCCLLCRRCKTELHSSVKFCPNCGLSRSEGEVGA